jgi:hypothetical protein
MLEKGGDLSKGGRPTKYSNILADHICVLLMNGESLIKICKKEDMPTRETIYQWLLKYKDFSDNYARARQIQADYYAELLVDESLLATDKDSAAAARAKFQALSWYAGKIKPKKYGEYRNGLEDEDKKPDPGDVTARLLEYVERHTGKS